MKKFAYVLLFAVLVLALVGVAYTNENTFYDGMMAQCLYIPYVYVDGNPIYQSPEGCQELVEDARRKDLYRNRRNLTGPDDAQSG